MTIVICFSSQRDIQRERYRAHPLQKPFALHNVIEDNASFISTECLQLLIDAFAATPLDYEILEVHINLLSEIILDRTILPVPPTGSPEYMYLSSG